MDKTQRLFRLLNIFSNPRTWSARDRLLVEEHQALRHIQYIYSRLRHDLFFRDIKKKEFLTDADLSVREDASQQVADKAHARVDSLFDRFLELRQLIIDFYPHFLSKLPIVDRANFESLDPAIVMHQFSELLGQVLQLDVENYRETRSPAEWEKNFKITHSTFRRWIEAGIIRVKEHTTKSISVHRDDVAHLTNKEFDCEPSANSS